MIQNHVFSSWLDNRLYRVYEELISYGTYEIDTLAEITNTVRNLKNGSTTAERIILIESLENDIGEV